MEVRVDGLGGSEGVFILEPGRAFESQFPMLQMPRGILLQGGQDEEERTPEEGRGAATITVALYNFSDRPVILPDLFPVGSAELGTGEVREEGADLDGKQPPLLATLGSGGGSEEDKDLLDLFSREPPSLEPLSDVKIDEYIEGKNCVHLTQGQRERLREWLRANRDVFAARPRAPGVARLPAHTIELTPGTRPIAQRAYRLGPDKEAAAQQIADELLAGGQVRESRSAWCSPIVLAKKKDGKWRFCVDMRKLNRVTVPDKFPLPRIDDLLDKLQGNRFFSTLDLASGYWQLPLADSARPLTAFAVPGRGLLEWNVLPMGLTNSPASFQRAMQMVLAGLSWEICLVYLDDICVFSAGGEEEHLERVGQVFARLREYGLSLKLEKCTFMAVEVEYLGHEVSRDGIRPSRRNLEAVAEAKPPTNVTEVKAFVGLCNYYSRFIPRFAEKREPLLQLTRANTKFVWGEQEHEAFEALKVALCSAPVLKHPDFSKPFIIQTDACAYGLGATLSQQYDDGVHPIAYIHKTLSQDERKWAVRELEALGVVWACEELRPYISGREFVVETDHESLQWLLDSKLPGRVARWAIRLQEFVPHMTLRYRKGEENGAADGLSRLRISALTAGRWVRLGRRFRALLSSLRAAPVCGCAGAAPCFSVLTRSGAGKRVEDSDEREEESETENELGESEGGQGVRDDDNADLINNDNGVGVPKELEQKKDGTGEHEGDDLDVDLHVPHDKTDPSSHSPKYNFTGSSFLEELRKKQREDPVCGPLVRFLSDDTAHLSPLELVQMESRAKHFVLVAETLYLRAYTRRNRYATPLPALRIVVPVSLRSFLTHCLHTSLTGVHIGSSRLTKELEKRFYWPGMSRYVRTFVRTCHACQLARARRRLRAGLMVPKGITAPGVLSVDIQTGYPTDEGYGAVLTMKDCFTHETVLTPLKASDAGMNTSVVVQHLVLRWVAFFGLPRVILSDRGPQFISDLMARLCERMGINRRLTSVYHAQTNTNSERQHRFHTALLKAVAIDHPRGWVRRLPYIQFACMSTVIEGLGMSPLELARGVPARLPVDLFALPQAQAEHEAKVDWHVHASRHAQRVRYAHELAARVKADFDKAAKARYDEGKVVVKYEVGAPVLVYKPPQVQGGRKLVVDFRGPFVVDKQTGPVSYSVRQPGRQVFWSVHVRNMVPYHVRPPEMAVTWMDVDASLPPPPRAPRAPARRQSPRLQAGGGEGGAAGEEAPREAAEPEPGDGAREGARDAEVEEGSAEAEEREENADVDPEIALRDEEERGMIELRNATNKAVQIAASPGKGLGVFARTGLQKGTVLGRYEGELLSPELHAARYPRDDAQYAVKLSTGFVVDAADFRVSTWPRYVNSVGEGQEPNVRLVEDEGQLYMEVVRPIAPGEELLLDYGDEYQWGQDGPVSRVSRIVPSAAVDLPALDPANSVDINRASEPAPAAHAPASVPANAAPAPANSPVVVKAEKPVEFVLKREDVGRCVLVWTDYDHPYRVGKVVSVDELGEWIELHLLGSYNLEKKGSALATWLPEYVDAKDGRSVFTTRPKASYTPFVFKAQPFEIKSAPFDLTKSRTLPPDLPGLESTPLAASEPLDEE